MCSVTIFNSVFQSFIHPHPMAEGTLKIGRPEPRESGRNTHGQAKGNAGKIRGLHERDAQYHRARCLLLRIPTRSAADG